MVDFGRSELTRLRFELLIVDDVPDLDFDITVQVFVFAEHDESHLTQCCRVSSSDQADSHSVVTAAGQ